MKRKSVVSLVQGNLTTNLSVMHALAITSRLASTAHEIRKRKMITENE